MKWNRWSDVREASCFDVVFVNRDLAGDGLFLEKTLLRSNGRVVFDFDDSIFVGRNRGSVAWMCANAAWVTPGNAYLADFAREYNDRVTVIPTVMDTDRYVVRDKANSVGPIRVGWSGSDRSIAETLFPYVPLMARLQARLKFRLVIISNSRPILPVNSLDWEFVPWRAEEEGRIGSTIDVGLMPLLDDAFQRGKCGMKLLQYMAAGLPTIASPVGVNSEITVPGETGFLARSDDEWALALESLLLSPDLRLAMGAAGRRRCEQRYSLLRWLPELIRIMEHVAGDRPNPTRKAS
jgi:hypothetical protein